MVKKLLLLHPEIIYLAVDIKLLQLNRFMFNVVIDYLPEDEEVAVVSRTTSGASEPIQALFTGQDIQQIHALVRKVPVAEDVVRFAVRLPE